MLEAGCGTGGNLKLLRRYGELDAFELDDVARIHARKSSGIDVQPGHLPDGMGNLTGPYNLIGLFDVLEHVRQDVESLHSLKGLLAPNGKIILTVPALPVLWSSHDVRHHHHRRYTRKTLDYALNQAGLKIEYISYFNFFLLPLAILQRMAGRLAGGQAAPDFEPPRLLNTLLATVFASERALLAFARLPIGLSICAICTAK